MASPLFLALLLIAGSAQSVLCASVQNAPAPGVSYIDIGDIIASIPDIVSNIIANLPDIIASLPGIIAEIDWREVLDTVQNAIQSLPDIIDRLPEIIANLPISDIVDRLREIVADLLDRLPEIIDSLPISIPDNIVAVIRDILDTVRGIIERLPEIIDRIREIIASIPDFVDIPAVVASASNLIERIREFIGLIDWESILSTLLNIDWSNIISNIPDIDWIGVITNLPDIIASLPEIIANIPDLVADLPIWGSILDALPDLERDHGEPASIQEFPSLVQVEVGFNNIWLQGCTGSILNMVSIVSSARCFGGRLFDPRIRRIKAGANIRGGDGDIYPVNFAIVHPTFGNDGFDGDITVVRIVGMIGYGPTVQPVSISGQGIFFPAGVLLTNAGWGSVAQGRNIANRDLFKADLYVVDNARCRDIYSNYAVSLTVTPNMICAGRARTGGRMSDLRDGGGPLYYQGVLVGTISFGRMLGNDSLPVVATSISSYTNWIVSAAS